LGDDALNRSDTRECSRGHVQPRQALFLLSFTQDI